MILGIGSDLVDIRRIELTLEKAGERFLSRVFTKGERALAESRKDEKKFAALATRFAAKEAAMKALSIKRTEGISWQDIEVVTEANGQPTLRLHGAAKKAFDHMVPAGHTPKLHISLTDEYPYGCAFVVLEALRTR